MNRPPPENSPLPASERFVNVGACRAEPAPAPPMSIQRLATMNRILLTLAVTLSALSLSAQAPAPSASPAPAPLQPIAPPPPAAPPQPPPAAETTPPTDAPKKPAKKKPASNTLPFRGKVESVDAKAMTITLAGKEKQRVFNVTSKTRLEKDGKPATFGDIKAGDDARGSYAKSKDGDNLIRAAFGPAPAPSAKKPKQPKQPAKIEPGVTEPK